jgi:hypothetical protein
MINTKLSEYFNGKELPISKSTLNGLGGWYSRLKQRSGHENVSPYGIKAVVEALYTTFGKIKSPEAPGIALYEWLTLKKIPVDGNPAVPKLMFTLFNGGKAIGSKVKFTKFYLIMNMTLESVQEGNDALLLYYKVSAAIKKAV